MAEAYVEERQCQLKISSTSEIMSPVELCLSDELNDSVLTITDGDGDVIQYNRSTNLNERNFLLSYLKQYSFSNIANRFFQKWRTNGQMVQFPNSQSCATDDQIVDESVMKESSLPIQSVSSHRNKYTKSKEEVSLGTTESLLGQQSRKPVIENRSLKTTEMFPDITVRKFSTTTNPATKFTIWRQLIFFMVFATLW